MGMESGGVEREASFVSFSAILMNEWSSGRRNLKGRLKQMRAKFVLNCFVLAPSVKNEKTPNRRLNELQRAERECFSISKQVRTMCVRYYQSFRRDALYRQTVQNWTRALLPTHELSLLCLMCPSWKGVRCRIYTLNLIDNHDVFLEYSTWCWWLNLRIQNRHYRVKDLPMVKSLSARRAALTDVRNLTGALFPTNEFSERCLEFSPERALMGWIYALQYRYNLIRQSYVFFGAHDVEGLNLRSWNRNSRAKDLPMVSSLSTRRAVWQTCAAEPEHSFRQMNFLYASRKGVGVLNLHFTIIFGMMCFWSTEHVYVREDYSVTFSIGWDGPKVVQQISLWELVVREGSCSGNKR